jgi:tetratricopeptide (TPR) repeat protein
MPRRATREGLHLALTDHTIPRRGDDQPAGTPTLPASAAGSLALRSAWPEDDASPATLGAAYVLWHETMGPRPEALRRGLALLQEALAQQPEERELRFWIGSAWVALGRGREARPHLEAAAEHPSLRPLALFRLGLACELTGDRRAALAAYEQLLREAPRWVEPYDRAADLYLADEQPDRAAAVLKLRLARLPDAAAIATWALAERLRGGTHEQALARLEEALRLDPRQPRVFRVRAMLWLLAGQRDMAQADLLRAGQLPPD